MINNQMWLEVVTMQNRYEFISTTRAFLISYDHYKPQVLDKKKFQIKGMVTLGDEFRTACEDWGLFIYLFICLNLKVSIY